MRIFLAVDIPFTDKLNKVYEILSKDGYCRLVNKNILHLTLHFYGEQTEKEVSMLKEVIKTVDFPSFEYDLNGIGFFPNEEEIQIIWIGLESVMIEAFYREVKNKFRFQPKQKFVPHITIARATQELDSQVRDELLKMKSDYFGSGKIDTLKLKKSTLTQSGPIYEDLAEVKLREV
ncbi:MAG: RNA 2',3'-cyclic phosphodiesterase [Candidatus Micrarchaeota archaeon]|nr:RNA 2',3'-cyclic phosphodiesterase [Candidatus Micrarchaeota archaeon]